jgi:hypothetical protein
LVVITGQHPEQPEETETVGCRPVNAWTIECGGRGGLPVIGGEPLQLPGQTPWFPQSWCDNFHILCSEGDCLIHDPLQKIEDASAQDGPPLLIDNALFYLDRYCLRSEADCERAIRRNTYSWHFLLLVVTYPIEAKHTLKSIVQQAECIVVGAYDGESYLIWRPSGDVNQP